MILASFHSKRTIPYFNDKLNTLASGILTCSTVSISSFGRNISTPGDLLSFISFIFFLQFLELQLTALNSPIYSPEILHLELVIN